MTDCLSRIGLSTEEQAGAEDFLVTQVLSSHALASWSAVITHAGHGRSLASAVALSRGSWLLLALPTITKRCRAALATRTPGRIRAFDGRIRPVRHFISQCLHRPPHHGSGPKLSSR